MSSKFEVVLATTNAAFDGFDGDLEVARILRGIADRLESGDGWEPDQPNRISDVNGNRVGYWAWTEGQE